MYRRNLGLLLCLFAFFSLAGCVSTPPEAPTAQMGAARNAVEQARQTGAAQSAPAEFNAARDKLARAEAAFNAQDYLFALRLAREAEADAQLAQAKTGAVKAQLALNEVHNSMRAMQPVPANVTTPPPAAAPSTVVTPPPTVIVPR